MFQKISTTLVITFTLSALVSTSSFAHLKIGKYAGKSADFSACSFEVKQIRFEGIKHPINERVDVVIGSELFVLSHLPEVNASVKTEESTVLFDGDHLTGAKGIPQGGVGVVLTMSHAEVNEGPVEITMITHAYKDPAKTTKWQCSGLAFQSAFH